MEEGQRPRDRHPATVLAPRRGTGRLLWAAVALALMAPPAKARARGRAHAFADGPPPHKQARRRADRRAHDVAPIASPCGRHTVKVSRGVVFLDGRRVHPERGSVQLLAPPAWRRDGRALAWLERHDGETRLVVVPDLSEPMAWALPPVTEGDRIFWAGTNRIVVGPALLAPRAVASWTP